MLWVIGFVHNKKKFLKKLTLQDSKKFKGILGSIWGTICYPNRAHDIFTQSVGSLVSCVKISNGGDAGGDPPHHGSSRVPSQCESCKCT